MYQATVASYVTVQFKKTDGTFSYLDVARPAASGTFVSASATITVPANIVSLTVFHLINQVGTLIIDDVQVAEVSGATPTPTISSTPTPTPSITPTPTVSPTPVPDPANLIANPSFEEMGSNGLPTHWGRGKWGTNDAFFPFPITNSDGSKAARVQIDNYSSGDAKWYFDYVPVQTGQIYQFSDRYRSNAATTVTVQFKKTDGSFSYLDLAVLPAAANWTNYSKTFTVPSSTVSLTVFHLIRSTGFLDTDDFSLKLIPGISTGYVSLNFDDGYLSTYQNALPILNAAGFKSDQFIITGRMNPQFPGYVQPNQVLDMQAHGHAIEAHTRTHPDLTALTPSELINEVQGSRDDLKNIGVTPVNYFAYPYGDYNSNVIQAVKNAGFFGARSSDGGFNDPANPSIYALKRKPMTNTTTFSQIKMFIDQAMADKTWVILLFHQVDDTGAEYAVTPELFQQVVNYLQSINVKPVTISEVLNAAK
jgi:peptidoglycan/xylan/chitin deacetylase (PgdA/CDA1 family)